MTHANSKPKTFRCSACGSEKRPFRRTLCGRCYDRTYRPRSHSKGKR
jgi:NMD protein affecting ribosome stability and mRNA decay